VFPIATLKRERSSGEIKHLPDRSLQIRNFVPDDIPHDLIMHPEVGVNENVSHARNLSPEDACMLSLEGSGNEFDGLTDHHEVPDHPILHKIVLYERLVVHSPGISLNSLDRLKNVLEIEIIFPGHT